MDLPRQRELGSKRWDKRGETRQEVVGGLFRYRALVESLRFGMSSVGSAVLASRNISHDWKLALR
jgi:hypothetical protein